jgi:hypothetical protein
MQADLLPFIDWSHHPRQIIAPEDRIITAGDPTDMLFLLEEGEALAPNAALRGSTIRQTRPVRVILPMRQGLCCHCWKCCRSMPIGMMCWRVRSAA